MAQNITLLGANYPDVPSVQLPITGGGTATFSDTRSVTYNLSGGATASVTPSEVVAGQGFSVKLKAPTGYSLSGVTVTMSGTDITSQVFTPDEAGGGGGGGPTYDIVVPEQTINATGTYTQITVFSENLIEGETYRITLDGTEYTDTAINLYGAIGVGYTISGSAWAFEQDGGNMYFDIFDSSLYGTHVVKLEKQTSSGGGGGGANLQTKSVSYTPTTSAQSAQVTADSGYDGLDQVNVSVGAIPSEYIVPSGTKSITENGTGIDVANYASVDVNVPSSGSSKNVQVVQGTTRTSSSTMTAIGAEMTVSKTGTYDVYWTGVRTSTSGSYTYATQLYINGSAYGSENTTWSNHVQNVHLSNVSLTAGQKLRVYGRESRNSSYYMYAGTLIIVEA